jgi:hypothetical protein
MSTATLTDMSILATDPTFGNRVFASLATYCTVTIPTETITDAAVELHVARKQLAASILANIESPNPWKQLFVNVVSVNQIVANDATANGTLVGMTQAEIATAAALCLDSDINNAVASAFNAFIGGQG